MEFCLILKIKCLKTIFMEQKSGGHKDGDCDV